MTATPERTDGYDTHQHFDHNIGYEIRLSHRAMEENMLCPFHYFGINDISVDGVANEEESEFTYQARRAGSAHQRGHQLPRQPRRALPRFHLW